MKAFSYLTHLNDEMKLKQSKNSKYSLRKFAHHLGISPGFLSQVLRREKTLSVEQARLICMHLNWDENRQKIFLLEVQFAMAKNQKVKEQIILELKSLLMVPRVEPRFEVPPQDAIQFKHWYYFAVLELTELADFKSDSLWIAKKLNLTQKQIEEAIHCLLKIGLLHEKKGKIIKKHKNYSLRRVWTEEQKQLRDENHLQYLEMAKKAIQQEITQRDFSDITISFSRKSLKDAKRIIAEFRHSFEQSMSNTKDEKDSIYTLGVQFIRVDSI